MTEADYTGFKEAAPANGTVLFCDYCGVKLAGNYLATPQGFYCVKCAGGEPERVRHAED